MWRRRFAPPLASAGSPLRRVSRGGRHAQNDAGFLDARHFAAEPPRGLGDAVDELGVRRSAVFLVGPVAKADRDVAALGDDLLDQWQQVAVVVARRPFDP